MSPVLVTPWTWFIFSAQQGFVQIKKYSNNKMNCGSETDEAFLSLLHQVCIQFLFSERPTPHCLTVLLNICYYILLTRMVTHMGHCPLLSSQTVEVVLHPGSRGRAGGLRPTPLCPWGGLGNPVPTGRHLHPWWHLGHWRSAGSQPKVQSAGFSLHPWFCQALIQEDHRVVMYSE